MSVIDTIFSWFDRTTQTNPTKQNRRDPNTINRTEPMVVNRALTKGLYHNQYPNMRLAGALAYNPIAVPVWFMGLPIPKSDNESEQELLKEIMDRFAQVCKQIHIETHRDGTVWAWPFFSARDRQLHWEIIPDESVIKIIKDIETGYPIKLIVSEQLTINDTDGTEKVVTRKREFTPEEIKTTWTGDTMTGDLSQSGPAINVAGILPVPFSNNPDGGEVRGHSDYERIVYDLKDYHDIDLMQSTILSKYQPKMVVNIPTGTSAKEWLSNNGFDSIGDIDPATSDLFINVGTDSGVEFVFPVNAYQAYESALKRKFMKIVEGSGIPEIAWGIKTQGNHASAEEQMGVLIQFVEDRREQKIESYQQLFSASLRLMGISRMQVVGENVKVKWGMLDGLSEKTKADVFKSFADGVSSLVSSAAFTKEQLYSLWQRLYPEDTSIDYDAFVVGISAMGKHKQWSDADYLGVLDSGLDGQI